MSKKGTVYFFTGLAGAGKTTIGGLFYERLKRIKADAILIDGDRVRSSTAGQKTGDGSDDEKYTTEYRRRGAFGSFEYMKVLSDRGRDVVICAIAMYKDVRAWNRENIENYREIYIRVRTETLYARNQKGLYSPGRKNVVGVDLPWDEPEHPDVVVQNDGQQSPGEIVDRLAELFLKE